MDKKIILGAAAGLLCVGGIAAWIFMGSVPANDPCAEIYLNGSLYRTVSLSENTEFTVECDDGYNTVCINNGEIYVSEADCPDKVCVNTAPISGGVIPIVCLPHRLEIRVVGGESIIDAAT